MDTITHLEWSRLMAQIDFLQFLVMANILVTAITFVGMVASFQNRKENEKDKKS